MIGTRMGMVKVRPPKFTNNGNVASGVAIGSINNNKMDHRFYCGFQIHVKKVTVVAACVGLTLCLIRLILWRNFSADDLTSIAFTMTLMIAYVLLLCAEHTKIHALYFPFLFLNPLAIFSLLYFYVNPLVGIVFNLPTLAQHARAVKDRALEQQKLFSLASSLVAYELFYFLVTLVALCWLEWAVYRAYHFSKYNKKQETEAVYRSVYFIDPRKQLN